jgi:hypothetical protein
MSYPHLAFTTLQGYTQVPGLYCLGLAIFTLDALQVTMLILSLDSGQHSWSTIPCPGGQRECRALNTLALRRAYRTK